VPFSFYCSSASAIDTVPDNWLTDQQAQGLTALETRRRSQKLAPVNADDLRGVGVVQNEDQCVPGVVGLAVASRKGRGQLRAGRQLPEMTSIQREHYSRRMAKLVPIGTRGEVERRVEFRHTLSAWKPELPPVLSTPHMIGWMEAAGFEALLPFCEGDEVSVGTAINIIHRAPTGVDTTVKCEAVLESINGRFLIFRVSAHNGSEVIGNGTIGRAIVSKSKFEQKHRSNAVAGAVGASETS
jgi:fluoroacetyl-CoA thioesterase